MAVVWEFAPAEHSRSVIAGSERETYKEAFIYLDLASGKQRPQAVSEATVATHHDQDDPCLVFLWIYD